MATATQTKPPWEMTKAEREAEVARLKKEHSAILSTPLMSAGEISPFQVGSMGKQQRARWERDSMRRMDIESHIKTLESDERIARAKARAEAEQADTTARTTWMHTKDDWVAARLADKPPSLSHLTDKQFAKFEAKRHAKDVKWAVAEGKPVPEKVLKDYPDLAPAIPKASPGSPEAGLQVDMMGKTTLVQPKGKGKATTASMDAYEKLESMKAEAKPKAEAKSTKTRTLSHEDARELLAGLELRAESIADRIDRGKAELEAMKEGLDPRLTKLTALIPHTKEGASEITHITKGQYRKVWGREPKPNVLTKDGKRVRWEYALDEVAQELHLEDKARAEGVAPDEYVKGLIEDALADKRMVAAMQQEIQSDEATLKAIERLKQDVKGREGEVTSAPLVASMAAGKPKARSKAEAKAKGMLADEAKRLIDKVQAKRSPQAIAMDKAILAQRVLPKSKVEVWAKAPNRYDIRGVDTPTKGKIKAGVGYADKGKKRLSRQKRKGWKKVKLA